MTSSLLTVGMYRHRKAFGHAGQETETRRRPEGRPHGAEATIIATMVSEDGSGSPAGVPGGPPSPGAKTFYTV